MYEWAQIKLVFDLSWITSHNLIFFPLLYSVQSFIVLRGEIWLAASKEAVQQQPKTLTCVDKSEAGRQPARKS